MRQDTRAYKLTLLSKIIAGKLSDKEVSNIRKSREPLYITMDLGGGESTPEDDDPIYHIEIYSDGTTKCYDRYADGRIEYRKT